MVFRKVKSIVGLDFDYSAFLRAFQRFSKVYNGDGKFALLGLVNESENVFVSPRFILFVTASWLDTISYNQKLTDLMKNLKEELNPDEYRKLETVIFLNSDNPMISEILERNGLVHFDVNKDYRLSEAHWPSSNPFKDEVGLVFENI